MHPWMLEQVANEHRRDLLARAQTGRIRTAGQPARPRWRRQRTTKSASTSLGAPFTAAFHARPRLRVLR